MVLNVSSGTVITEQKLHNTYLRYLQTNRFHNSAVEFVYINSRSQNALSDAFKGHGNTNDL